MSAAIKRRGAHGASVFSGATRRRLLAMLLEQALAGSVSAAESLLRLNADYGNWTPFPVKTHVVEPPL